MRKLLLVLLLLGTVGCETTPYYWETEAYKEAVEDKETMLTDGRIHIGITDNKFAGLWQKPHDEMIDRSHHLGGITEWWTFDYNCEPCHFRSDSAEYYFCFENGILTYWSEN